MILARNVVAGTIVMASVIALLALTSGIASAAAKTTKPAKPAKPAHTLAFDGHYAGAMTPSPSLSKPGCPTIQVDDLTIEDGTLKPASAAPSLQPVFDGFVTDEGFITGHVTGGGRDHAVRGARREAGHRDRHQRRRRGRQQPLRLDRQSDHPLRPMFLAFFRRAFRARRGWIVNLTIR